MDKNSQSSEGRTVPDQTWKDQISIARRLMEENHFLRTLEINLPFWATSVSYHDNNLLLLLPKEKVESLGVERANFRPLTYRIAYKIKNSMQHVLELNLQSNLKMSPFLRKQGFYYTIQHTKNVIIRKVVNPDKNLEKEIHEMLEECQRFASIYCTPNIKKHSIYILFTTYLGYNEKSVKQA